MDILALGADERVSQVKVDEKALTVTLKDGRTIAVPLTWYPKLLNASPKQRKNWRIAGGGDGIHWPELDEDLAPRACCVAHLFLEEMGLCKRVHSHRSRNGHISSGWFLQMSYMFPRSFSGRFGWILIR